MLLLGLNAYISSLEAVISKSWDSFEILMSLALVEKKMKLNISKTKNIIFNFSKNNQFSTEIKLDGEVIETVSETKLLGTTITNDLNWKKNTDRIVKESNKRMVFLHKLARFTKNKEYLKNIYILQIRSKLEQSSVVWHSSFTKKCEDSLERVQKSALKIILGESL